MDEQECYCRTWFASVRLVNSNWDKKNIKYEKYKRERRESSVNCTPMRQQ